MWGDPDPDPGGQTEPTKTPSTQELIDLKDQNEQQLLLIAQLKEMLRKEQSNVTQEKVEEYVNTLSKAKAKRNSRAKKDESSSSSPRSSVNIDSGKKERINLLRQQLEENKAKLAERGKSQKGIEEMVTQLQAQLKDSKQLISSNPLNLSTEHKNIEYNKNTCQEDLYNILLTKEKRITELINKTQKLEATVLDLQENLKEKDSVIDARTKAITLMTDSLSKKGKNTLDALEETKEQMRKMQEHFVHLESEMKARQVSLLNDLKSKNIEIIDLQETNNRLEEERLGLLKKIEENLISEKVMMTEEVDSSGNGMIKELEELKQANEENENRVTDLEKILHDKDAVIQDLEQILEATKADNENNKEKLIIVEKELQDTKSDLQRLKNIGFSSDSTAEKPKDTTNELEKLKKQLDESNKNMIKVKAQNKSKIKELNKRLDQIKKASDVNALVVQLQKEKTKLNEKVAELEEEIGNLQLKMVDSMSSSKDSFKFIEENKDFDAKVAKFKEEIDEKDKIISILESEVLNLKDEISQQNTKINDLSHLETQQVKSELTSIDFEERLEIVENEKKQLIKEKENLLHEKDELLDNIETLKKEKQELSSKLDNYIQENMDLIDKLEKLSAEKVSSAESIEIVEGLTQQEKLELAAYQKTIHPGEEPLKCVEDDNTETEPAVELNESVMQLSEDTTELLHKIEMFTHERKEVMLKMEALKEENNSLALKLKEVENNRDILAETYEQLQNEKEELQAKLEVIDVHREKADDTPVDHSLLELKSLQEQYEKLLRDNEELKRTLKDYDTVIHEKHNLESELRESRSKINELENKIALSLEDIYNYQQVIEENKNELITSSGTINQLQDTLAKRETDIQELNAMINELNEVITNLQNETSKLDNVEILERELSELKLALNTQIEQAQEYEAEISQNSETIKNLTSQLIEMNRRLLEYDNEVAVKDDELKKLSVEIKNKDEIISNLRMAIEEKDRNFKTVSEEIKEKYLGLQKQLDGNNDSLSERVHELTNKNKEQLDKMKKIAANLKKKTQAYQELEEQFETDKKKWQSLISEKDSKLASYEDHMESLTDTIKSLEENVSAKTTELEGTERHIQILREQLQGFELNNVDLQNYILELKSNDDKQREVISKQQLSLSLHEDFDRSTKNVSQDKMDELNTIIETLRTELVSLKQTADTLKEAKGHLEEQKGVLENKVGELEEKLKKVVANLKKKTVLYQELQKNYNEDKEKWENEVKEKDLKSAQFEEEFQRLTDKIRALEEDNHHKRMRLDETEKEINMLKDHLQSMERNNVDMQNYISEQRRREEQNQINLQQELSTSLHGDFDNDKSAEFLNKEKVKELNMVVETLECDLVHYKERIDRLQETNAKLQEENGLMESRIAELEEKLDLTSNSFKEKSLLEDQLELRLAEITASDEVMNKKLQETIHEHQELLTKNQENEELIKKLKIKLKKSQDKVTELKLLQNNLEELENLNDELKKQVTTLEINQKHIQNENESLQKRNMSDYEKIEADYQIQLEELLKAKNDLTVECEKLEDKIKEMQEREEELLMEVAEYKFKLEQSEAIELEEVERLNNDLTTANENLEKSTEDIDRLNQRVTELQQELLAKTAKITVDEVIEEAQKVLNRPSVSTQTENLTVFDSVGEVAKQPIVTSNVAETKMGGHVDEPNRDQIIELFSEDASQQDNQTRVPTFHWSDYQNQEAVVPQTQSQLNNLSQNIEAPAVQNVNWFNMTHAENVPNVQSPADWFEVAASQPQDNGNWFNTPQEHQVAGGSQWFDIQQQQQPGRSEIQELPTDAQQESASSNAVEQGTALQAENIPPITDDQNTNWQQEVSVVETSKEALLNKIKALEFLLYNVDKEKEIALNECTEMFSEFTHFVYEKLNEIPPKFSRDQPLGGVESQILSDKDVADAALNKDELRQVEFEKVRPSFGEQPEPVAEDVIKPKQAYLCFDEDEGLHLPTVESQIQSVDDISKAASDRRGLQQLEYEKVTEPVTEPVVKPKEAYICFNEDDEVKPSTSIDSQVLSGAEVDNMKSNKKELQQIEFEKVDPSQGEQKLPVVEPVAKPKQAYLSYAKDDGKQHSLEAFGENDDGWAWGPEEARLEEEHIKTRDESPYMQNVQQEIEQLRENLLALQHERENHLEEIKQLQVKSGKLIKKCKELKAKNDDLNKKARVNDAGVDFFDLNETIQEELKGQVEQLEKKLKELTMELEKEKTEKSCVLKKVDVLTSAHERMVEMKEIQDTEVFRWQRKHREAVEKLQQYEWGNDGFGEARSKVADNEATGSSTISQVDVKTVNELEKTIKELMLDNDELQALLDEQVKLRTNAEKSEKGRSDQEYQNLRESLDSKCDELAEKEAVLYNTNKQLQDITQDKEELRYKIVELQSNIEEKDDVIKKLQAELQMTSQENFDVRSQLSREVKVESELNRKIAQLQEQLIDIEQQKSDHENALREKEAVIEDLQENFERLGVKKIELEQQVKDLNAMIERHREEIAQLHLDNESKIIQIQRLSAQAESKTQDFGALERLQEEITRLQFKIQEKDANIKSLNELFEKMSSEKTILDSELKQLKENLISKELEIRNINQENAVLKEEVKKLQDALQNKDVEFEEKSNALMSELAQTWQAQVDQRGADVAESWKLHLESVETEYSTVQQKLRQEIAELEEKCNILVNENNELRKNVDVEIRNEVDKLSALQQQIHSGQQTIADLSSTLLEKDREINEMQNIISQTTNYEQEIQRLSSELSEKETKLSSINIIVDTTQKQFDEKREVVEEIVRVLEKNALSPLSFEKTDVLNEFQRQLGLIQEKDNEIVRLSQTIDDFHNRLNVVSEKDQEILRLNDIIAGLQAQLSMLSEKDNEILRLNEELQQTKFDLDSTIQEYGKLQQEHANSATVLVEYQQKIVETTAINTTLQQTIEAKNQQISSLTQQLQDVESHKSDTNKDVEKLYSEIEQLKQDSNVLQQGLSESQTVLFNVTENLREKSEHLETVTQQLTYSQQNYEIQQQELDKLRHELQEKEREYVAALQHVQQNQLHDLQHHYEELLHGKEIDMQHLKSQLDEVLQSYQQSSDKLLQEAAVRQELEAKVTEQSALIDEENKQLSELRLLIENQVLKIEELKKELFDKSNQYDSIIAEMDMSRQAVTQQPSASHNQPPIFSQIPEQQPVPQQRQLESDDLSEPANRAELDLALYMLHQRDVRCEELTVELTQLLEERDTLQLRLSNAIREKEELRRRNAAATGEEAASSQLDTSTELTTPRSSKSSATFLTPSGTDLTQFLDLSSHNQDLATKLSELKNVGYKKDKTFVDEQELRRFQQMAIMQQHINDASRLPPEAAAKLVDASYTLSRDVQSPSKVLLNWLWGRSTPKVDDT